MASSRRRSNASLFESSTIITANLIMASSSYLLSRFTAPRVPAEPSSTKIAAATASSSTAWPSAADTRSVEPMAGCRTVLMEPVGAGGGRHGRVDRDAEVYIKRFRERTRSEAARQEAAPPTKWAGTVHRYQR